MVPANRAGALSIHDLSLNILRARKRQKLKQEVLGMLLGCSRSYISKLEKGIALPSPALAARLEEKLSLPKGELVRAVVRMKLKEAALKKQAVEAVRGGRVKFHLDENVLVPLYASTTRAWNDGVDSYIAIPKSQIQVNGSRMFLLRAPDNSMDRAGIHKGDILLVEVRDVKNNDICVYCIGKDCFIRRYRKINGRIKMVPESMNKKNRPETYDPFKMKIEGVVRSLYLKKPLFFDGARP